MYLNRSLEVRLLKPQVDLSDDCHSDSQPGHEAEVVQQGIDGRHKYIQDTHDELPDKMEILDKESHFFQEDSSVYRDINTSQS